MRKFTEYESMAKLDMTETERVALKERFEQISTGFNALEAYETDEVKPLVTVLDTKNVFREDKTAKFMPREELLKNAPEQHDGYFQVPAAID